MTVTSLAPPAATARSLSPSMALAALVGGNVALAFGALFVRLSDTGPVASAFWRLALAVPVLALIAMRERNQDGHRVRIGWLPVIAGLFFAADLASWHIGIFHTRLANATLLGNSTSLFLVLAGIIAARALPGWTQRLAILLAALGAALLMGRSLELGPDTLMGDWLSILAGLLYTGYVLAMQRLRGEGHGPWMPLLIATATGAPILLGAAWMLDEPIWPALWWPLIALALSSQVVGQGLTIIALPHFSPLVIGLSLLLQPAIAAVAGWMMFDEVLGPWDGVGALMIAAALVLVRLPDRALAGQVEA